MMKSKRKNEFIFLFIITMLCSLIYCTTDCSTCTISNNECTGCDSNCKPNHLGSCVECDLGSNRYYLIKGDGTCESKSSCDSGLFVIYGKHECVSSCGNDYTLGDFCYENLDSNWECDSSKLCHCKYKYYITTTDTKNEYHCLGPSDNCPPDYNSYYNNKCIEGDVNNICPSRKKKN